jgi:transcriptional regulator with XRE-family HTH domain
MASRIKDDALGSRLQQAFGARMKALRKALGLKQGEFGAIYGRSRACVAAWETAYSWAQPETIYRVCRDYQLTADFLYYGETGGLTVERLHWLVEKGVIKREY